MNKIIKGSCHCGDTAFEIQAEPNILTRCTCSICAKRGALWVYCQPNEFQLLKKPMNESIYRWRDKLVKSHFCGVCGCSTYNESPTSVNGKPDFNAPLIAVNARLLIGVELDTMEVQIVDGKNLW